MFDAIRASVIRSDVSTARKANRVLVGLKKRGWGSGTMADDARKARDNAMKSARIIKQGGNK